MAAFAEAEKRPKPSPNYLFTEVYKEVPPHLQKQSKEMKEHVTKHAQHYPLDRHDPF